MEFPTEPRRSLVGERYLAGTWRSICIDLNLPSMDFRLLSLSSPIVLIIAQQAKVPTRNSWRIYICVQSQATSKVYLHVTYHCPSSSRTASRRGWINAVRPGNYFSPGNSKSTELAWEDTGRIIWLRILSRQLDTSRLYFTPILFNSTFNIWNWAHGRDRLWIDVPMTLCILIINVSSILCRDM